jgi:hypothetical protein
MIETESSPDSDSRKFNSPHPTAQSYDLKLNIPSENGSNFLSTDSSAQSTPNNGLDHFELTSESPTFLNLNKNKSNNNANIETQRSYVKNPSRYSPTSSNK